MGYWVWEGCDRGRGSLGQEHSGWWQSSACLNHPMAGGFRLSETAVAKEGPWQGEAAQLAVTRPGFWATQAPKAPPGLVSPQGRPCLDQCGVTLGTLQTPRAPSCSRQLLALLVGAAEEALSSSRRGGHPGAAKLG